MQKFFLHFALVCIMLLGITSSVFGQGATTSTMNGKITDKDGAPLPLVTVQAIHEPTGTNYGTVANEDGKFYIPNMRAGGPYKVVATYVGFEDATQAGVFLTLGQTYKVNLAMSETDIVLEQVVVTATSGDIFDGNRTGAETYVSEEAINTLPTVDRNFLQDFARLDPRTAPSQKGNANGGGLSVAGMNNRYNAIFFDGAVNNDVFGLANSGTNGGQAGITPISPDAIEQISIVLAPYDVTYGGFAGASINAVTRSGTNNFEGSVYGFYKDENFAGKTAGQDLEEREKLAPFTSYTTGFRLGGPLVKNKLFFFANLEIQRDEEPKPFDPATYQGMADAAKLTQLTNYLNSEYGYDPGGYLNNATTRTTDRFLLKLDWNIDPKNSLSARYSYVKGVEEDVNRPNNTTLPFANAGVFFPSTTNSATVELKSTLSDNLFNKLVVGVTTVRDDRDILGDPFPRVQAQDGNATVIFGTDNFSYSNIVFQDVYTITDNLSISAGKHTFTVGTHNEFFKIQNLFTIFSTPLYFYDNQVDDNGNITQTGLDAFLSGAPAFSLFGHEQPLTPGDGASVRFGDAADNLGPTFNAAQLAFYVQDDWEISDNFKLSLGLRADIPIFVDDPPLQNDDFNKGTIPQLEAAGYDLKGAQASKAPSTSIMLAPRIGFNWDVNGDQRTQVRGGTGIFTSRVPWVWPGGMFIRNGLNSSFAPGFGPFRATPNEWRDRLNLNSPSGDVDLFAEDFKYPQFWRSSLAVDQKLPGNMILTVEGMYTDAINDLRVTNVNQVASTERLQGADNRPIFSGDVIDDTYNYITLVDNTNQGYTANLSVQLQKPFANDWLGSIAYSFTRAVSLYDGTGFINSTNWRENPSVQGRNSPVLTRATFDAGSRLSAFVAKKFRWNENVATTISLFYNGQSGQPFTYVYTNGDALTGEDSEDSRAMIYVPASQNEIVFADQSTAAAQWAALDAFISGDDYLSSRRGQYVERNMSRTPFENLFDLKIAQDVSFKVGEKKHTFQITFDIFNLGNFLNPNWGKSYFIGDNGYFRLLRFVDFEPGTTTPRFAFDGVDGDPWTLIQTGTRSARWYSQIGVRYSF